MTDGDFGGDGGGFDGDGAVDGHDGGPLDLNHNGTSVDEFILFAAITDGARRRSGGGPSRRSGCLLPMFVLLGVLLAISAL